MDTTSFSFPQALFPGGSHSGHEAATLTPTHGSRWLESRTPVNLHDRDKYRNTEGLNIDGVQECDGTLD